MGKGMMPHNKKRAGHMRVKLVRQNGSGKYLTKCGIETWKRFTVKSIKGVTCKECKGLIDDTRGAVTVLPERGPRPGEALFPPRSKRSKLSSRNDIRGRRVKRIDIQA